MDAAPHAPRWERYAWAAGVLFVLALLAEVAIAVGIPIDQNDSAAKIAAELAAHRHRAIAIACLSAIYAPMFVVYLSGLSTVLRGDAARPRLLDFWVGVGGVLFVTLHAVSDVGLTGMLGAKVATFSAQHDPGVAYTLYLTTFALDSVGDLFGSLFAIAAGLLVLRGAPIPRWLGWVAIVAGALLFLQVFGLGGVIATFGLVLDLIGFALLLLFVLASSVALLRRRAVTPRA